MFSVYFQREALQVVNCKKIYVKANPTSAHASNRPVQLDILIGAYLFPYWYMHTHNKSN